MIIYYLLSIFYRAVSGAQNGAYYGKRMPLASFLTIVLITLSFLTGLMAGGVYTYLFLLPIAPIVWLYAAFLFKQGKWIHTAESLVTGIYTLLIAFIDLPTAILSVYPGLVLHKLGVNILAGLPALYEGTDDPTGKTYNIFLFGKEFHIPRSSFPVRIIIGVLSIIGWWAYTTYIDNPISIVSIFRYVFH